MNVSRICLQLAWLPLAGNFACMNMSSHQTGEVLGVGETRAFIGGGTFSSPSLNAAVDQINEDSDTNIQLPYLEGGIRYGFTDKLEGGLKATMIGTGVANLKYQLLKTESVAIAAGAGIGYIEYSAGDGDDALKTTFYDAIIPIYTSYRLKPWLALYATPQYVARVGTSTAEGAETSMANLLGSSLGIMLGEKAGLTVEGTYMQDVSSEFNMLQAGVGFFW